MHLLTFILLEEPYSYVPQTMLFTGIGITVYFFFSIIFHGRKSAWKKPRKPLSLTIKRILEEKVAYYSLLTKEEKKFFQYRVHTFLLNVKITGVKTTVMNSDKALIAASAVIPVFGFPDWEYTFLDEVLLYPGDFSIRMGPKSIKMRGLVGGGGYLEGKMLFSRKALEEGFDKSTDKLNVGIHEFTHLIDKDDEQIDGVPEELIGDYASGPWIRLMRNKMAEIANNSSDIRKYGATRDAEFLAVTTEYFFERPLYMKKKHPRLYNALTKIYKQHPAVRKQTMLRVSATEMQEECPCESGLLFKNCCIQFNDGSIGYKEEN